jgi:hypothetical protein
MSYTRSMSCYIDASGQIQHERGLTLALNCPHCQVLAHITPIAVPGFMELSRYRPKAVGVVYRCDACHSAIFLRFPVKLYGAQRIELGAQFQEVERLEERFSYTHLPEDVELLFREALGCYTHGHFNAFASMCRRTMSAVFARMTEANKLWVSDLLNEARKLADLDDGTFDDVRRIVTGSDTDHEAAVPLIDELHAGALVEVMKDLLYQIYVRKGRLQQAMSVRRFFSDESMRGLRVSGTPRGD